LLLEGAGWGYLLLACLGYIPGFVFYAQARREVKLPLTRTEMAIAVVIAILGLVSIPLTAVGIIPVF